MAKSHYNLEAGTLINDHFRILELLGSGYEGDVYKVQEKSTQIIRAAKFFLPKRNVNNQSAKRYAKKLHKLRNCSVLISYLTQDVYEFENINGEIIPITYLVSDFVEGETLASFLKKFPGKRLPVFQALSLLHSLVAGLEEMHAFYEYHGDLHTDNVIITGYGLGFDVKLLDMFHWGTPKSQDFKDDVTGIIRLFYDFLGGKEHYAKLPHEVKYIIGGLKKSLILSRFKNMSQLRFHLENLNLSVYK